MLVGAVAGFASGAGVGIYSASSVIAWNPLIALVAIVAAAFFGIVIGLLGAVGAYVGYRLARERRPLVGLGIGSAASFVATGALFSLIQGWSQLLIVISVVALVLGTAAFVLFGVLRTRAAEAKRATQEVAPG